MAKEEQPASRYVRDGEWTPEGQALLQRFHEEPDVAFEKLFRIQDRANPRRALAPLKLNVLQRRLYRDINRIRALNLARHARIDPEAAATIHTLTDLDVTTGTHKAAVEALEAWGIQKLLIKARQAHLPDLRDGPVQMVLLKHRRGGMSTVISALGFHQAHFGENTRVEIHAQKGEAVENILDISNRFYNSWPARDLGVYRNEASSLSRSRIEWDSGSRFVVHSAGAKDSARSFEADFYLLSEYAFYPDHAGVAAALAAGTTTQWVFKESTANGTAGAFHDEFWSALPVDAVLELLDAKNFEKLEPPHWNGYFRWFFGWTEDPLCRMPVAPEEAKQIKASLDPDEKALIGRFPKLSPEQLRFRRWKMSQFRSADMSPAELFRQEYPATPEEAFQAKTSKIFDQATLANMDLRAAVYVQNQTRGYVYLHEHAFHDGSQLELTSPYGGNLVIHEPPDPEAPYVIGADVSQGLVTSDDSVAVVLKRCSLVRAVEVATWHGKIPAKRFGDILTLLAEYYNQAFLLPEVNGPGLSTCDRIVENLYPFIYHRKALDQVDSNGIALDNAWRYGFYTNSQGKAKAVESLKLALVEGNIEIRSLFVLEQLKLYETNDRGRYSAPRGKNDDAAVATALAYLAHADDDIGIPYLAAKNMQKAKALESKLPEHDRLALASIAKRKKKAGERNARLGRRANFQPPTPDFLRAQKRTM